MIITTPAIVLQSRKYSESSIICQLYTCEHGKVSVIAKGARKPKSKFGSSVQPLGVIQATYYFKAGRELHTLSNAESVFAMRTLVSSYNHLRVGLAIAESVYATQQSGEANPALYELLLHTLAMLNDSDEQKAFSYFVAFNIRMAEMMGFMMDFESCAITQEPIVRDGTPEYVYSMADGTPLSSEFSAYSQGYRLTANALFTMKDIAETELSDFDGKVISQENIEEIHNFITNYYSYHLERRFVYRTSEILLNE